MELQRVTDFLHYLLRPFIGPGDRVVDGTVGNGHDALFLARAVGEGGHLTGFDIQDEAIAETRRRLIRGGIGEERFRLLRASHDTVREHVEPGIASAVFNLGFRPGSDRSVRTVKESTLAAAAAVLPLLRPGGVLALTLYRGHEGGAEEAQALERWAAGLDHRSFRVLRLAWPNLPNDPPSILLVQRARGPA